MAFFFSFSFCFFLFCFLVEVRYIRKNKSVAPNMLNVDLFQSQVSFICKVYFTWLNIYLPYHIKTINDHSQQKINGQRFFSIVDSAQYFFKGSFKGISLQVIGNGRKTPNNRRSILAHLKFISRRRNIGAYWFLLSCQRDLLLTKFLLFYCIPISISPNNFFFFFYFS